jgi:hypothetical protein
MSEESQIVVPQSFIDLYMEAGRIKPTAPRDEIAQRYELCEDLATALTETARTILWQHGVTEQDVLERVHAGLAAPQAGLSAAEAVWVTRRLAELLEWS